MQNLIFPNVTTGRPRAARRGIIALIAVVAGAMMALTAPAVSYAATSDTQTVRSVAPVAQTWATTRHPKTPQYRQPYLSTTRTADAAYVKFDTGAAVAGRRVVAAALVLTVRSTQATKGGIEVRAASNAWNAQTLTAAAPPVVRAATVNTAVVRAVARHTVTVPLATSSISATGQTSFQLRYSQPYVGTTFARNPTLRLTLGAAAAADAPVAMAEAPSSGVFAGKVFAHYFPPYPVSLDNAPSSSDYYARQYLSPSGEGGKYAAVGGLLRDRPLPRAPLAGDWRVQDLVTEVDEASASGIDGFTVDVMNTSGSNWTTTTDLFTAAQRSGRAFRVVPNVDVTGGIGGLSPAQVAAALAKLYASPAAYRLPDGRYVLSSFRAEAKPVAWWSQVRSVLKNTYHMDTAFIAVFLDASDANMKAFAPISWAEGLWGQRTPATVAALPDYAAKAHALNVKWMAPVAVQDVRPRSGLYAEAGNTETLRATWQQAIDDGADMVQLVTWNDYSEGTSFAPSVAHGYAFLDISAYYAAWFKTGKRPAITHDEAVVTHRVQLFATKPQVGTRLMAPTLNGTSMAPRNTVEVLTMLTAPARVRAVIGGHTYTADAPAGMSAVTFPLSVGTVSATVTRGDAVVMNVVSPFPVTATPRVQDLQYYAVTAR